MLLIREIPPPSYKHNFYSTFSLQVKLEILIPLAQERLRIYISAQCTQRRKEMIKKM